MREYEVIKAPYTILEDYGNYSFGTWKRWAKNKLSQVMNWIEEIKQQNFKGNMDKRHGKGNVRKKDTDGTWKIKWIRRYSCMKFYRWCDENLVGHCRIYFKTSVLCKRMVGYDQQSVGLLCYQMILQNPLI